MTSTAGMVTALDGAYCPVSLCGGLHGGSTPGAVPMAFDIVQAIVNAWASTAGWVQHSYDHAPALMLGLVALFTVPPLALIGEIVRRRRAYADYSAPIPQTQVDADAEPAPSEGSDGLTWPVDARIEIEGTPGVVFPIGRELMRIGRDSDNDLVLHQSDVHRSHAVIHRSEDAEILIIDMSGSDGNGLLVNGQRVARARLRNNDVIAIGTARLKFTSRWI